MKHFKKLMISVALAVALVFAVTPVVSTMINSKAAQSVVDTDGVTYSLHQANGKPISWLDYRTGNDFGIDVKKGEHSLIRGWELGTENTAFWHFVDPGKGNGTAFVVFVDEDGNSQTIVVTSYKNGQHFGIVTPQSWKLLDATYTTKIVTNSTKFNLSHTAGIIPAVVEKEDGVTALKVAKTVDGQTIVNWYIANLEDLVGYEELIAGMSFDLYETSGEGEYDADNDSLVATGTIDAEGFIVFVFAEGIVALGNGWYVIIETLTGFCELVFETPEPVYFSLESISDFNYDVKYTIVNGHGWYDKERTIPGRTLNYPGLNNDGDLFYIGVTDTTTGAEYPSFCANAGSKNFAGDNDLDCTGYMVAAASAGAEFVSAFNYIEANYGNVTENRAIVQTVIWALLGAIDVDSELFDATYLSQEEKAAVRDVIANSQGYAGAVVDVVYMLCENPEHTFEFCQPQLVPVYGKLIFNNTVSVNGVIQIQIDAVEEYLVKYFEKTYERTVQEFYSRDVQDFYERTIQNFYERTIQDFYERTIQDFYARDVQKFYERLVQDFYERDVQDFYERDVQKFYERTIQDFYERTVQDFYERDVQEIFERTVQDFYQRTVQNYYEREVQDIYKRFVQNIAVQDIQHIFEQKVWQEVLKIVNQYFLPVYQRTTKTFGSTDYTIVSQGVSFNCNETYAVIDLEQAAAQGLTFEIVESSKQHNLIGLQYNVTVDGDILTVTIPNVLFADICIELMTGTDFASGHTIVNPAFGATAILSENNKSISVAIPENDGTVNLKLHINGIVQWVEDYDEVTLGYKFVGYKLIDSMTEVIISPITDVYGCVTFVETVMGEYRVIETVEGQYELCKTIKGKYKLVDTVYGDYEVVKIKEGEYKLVDTNINEYELVETVFGEYGLVETATGDYVLANVVKTDYELVKTEKGEYKLVETVEGEYELVKIEKGEYELVETVEGDYVLVKTEKGEYELVRTIASSYELVKTVEGKYELVETEKGEYELKSIRYVGKETFTNEIALDYTVTITNASAEVVYSGELARGLFTSLRAGEYTVVIASDEIELTAQVSVGILATAVVDFGTVTVIGETQKVFLESIYIDNELDAVYTDNKLDDVKTDVLLDDVKTDVKLDDVETDVRLDDVKTDNKLECVKTDKKLEDVETDNKLEDVKTTNKLECVKTDKKLDDVETDVTLKSVYSDNELEAIYNDKQLDDKYLADKKLCDEKTDVQLDDVFKDIQLPDSVTENVLPDIINVIWLDPVVIAEVINNY